MHPLPQLHRKLRVTCGSALANPGGGVVDIAGGTFLSGSIFLKKGVELHLAAGAVVRGNPGDVLRDFTFENVDVKLNNGAANLAVMENLKTKNFLINGQPYAPAPAAPPAVPTTPAPKAP